MNREMPRAQHTALRALAEGAEPTLALLADASQRALGPLMLRAEKEAWKIGREERVDLAARIRATASVLVERLEAATRASSDGGGRIDKAEIDGLVSIIRGLEKVGEMMRTHEAAVDNQTGSDDELAALLELINDRIIELAHAFAAELG